MKKLIYTILFLSLFFSAVSAANVLPDTILLNPVNTYGVYQVGHSLVVYSEPNELSAIKQKIVWDNENVIPKNLNKTNMFIVYLENKDFALMQVTDETDEWVEVIYDSATGDKGWIKKDDPFKFNTWIDF